MLSLALFLLMGVALIASSPRRRSHAGNSAIGGAPGAASSQLLQDEDEELHGPRWCSFGSSTGHWADADHLLHRHWQLHDPGCPLQDLVRSLVEPRRLGIKEEPNGTTAAGDNSTSAAAAAQTAAKQQEQSPAARQAQPRLELPPRLSEVTRELDRLAAMAASTSSLAPTVTSPTTTTSSKAPADDSNRITTTPLQVKPSAASAGALAGSGAAAATKAADAAPGGAAGSTVQLHGSAPGEPSAASAASARSARVLFLSDSVDRLILSYLCELAGGKVRILDLADGDRRAVPLGSNEQEQEAPRSALSPVAKTGGAAQPRRLSPGRPLGRLAPVAAAAQGPARALALATHAAPTAAAVAARASAGSRAGAGVVVLHSISLRTARRAAGADARQRHRCHHHHC